MYIYILCVCVSVSVCVNVSIFPLAKIVAVCGSTALTLDRLMSTMITTSYNFPCALSQWASAGPGLEPRASQPACRKM